MSAIRSQDILKQIEIERQDAVRAARQATAWRIEGTLREFPKFDPVNAWFRYPVHVLDETLQDIKLEEDPKENWKRVFRNRMSHDQKRQQKNWKKPSTF